LLKFRWEFLIGPHRGTEEQRNRGIEEQRNRNRGTKEQRNRGTEEEYLIRGGIPSKRVQLANALERVSFSRHIKEWLSHSRFSETLEENSKDHQEIISN